MTFWQVVWLIVISFAFAAYLLVLFSVVRDVFRDPRASGLVKAAWILALVFAPVLAALVYLVVNGQGMAERQSQVAGSRLDRQDAYLRTASPGSVTSAEWERLKARPLG